MQLVNFNIKMFTAFNLVSILCCLLLFLLIVNVFFMATLNKRDFLNVKYMFAINLYILIGIYMLTLWFFFFFDFSAPVCGIFGHFYFSDDFSSVFKFTNFSFLGFFSYYVDGLASIFLLLLTFLIPICLVLNVYHPFMLVLAKNAYVIDCLGNPEQSFSLEDATYLASRKNLPTNDGTKTFSELKREYMFFLREPETFVYLSKAYFSVFFLVFLELVLFLFFVTTDLLYFYVLFEASMIPLYFLIGVFGSRLNRIKASSYLFFFTVSLSILFLLAVLFLRFVYGSSDIFLLSSIQFPDNVDRLVWLMFFLPLAVKIPVVPFHV